jgi:uncharacterized FlaG/YvyC family protein
MAVEDTAKIESGIQPAQQQVRVAQKKGNAQVSEGPVSSPAVSFENSTVEKTKVNATNIHSDNASSDVLKPSQEKEALTTSKLEEITEGINTELSFFSSSVQFKIEEVETSDSGSALNKEGDSSGMQINKKEVVVSVVDKRTGEVIRQIPPEDLLQSLNNVSMFLGLIIDQIA